MKIEEITKVAKLMKQYDLTEFCLEGEDVKMCMKRESGGPVMPAAYMMTPAAGTPPPTAATATADGTAADDADGKTCGETINSPIVGTFYVAPAPDAPPFVKAGDEVEEETVVCIVEAMKVMNEIRAERRGRVKRILVDNGKPVEFGQPLIELEVD